MNHEQFRAAALAQPGAEEKSHQRHPDFRLGGKIFASLGYPNGEWAMVKLPTERQLFLTKEYEGVFVPATGAWGRMGSTLVHLPKAKVAIVRAALKDAAAQLAPKSGATAKTKKSGTKRKAKAPASVAKSASEPRILKQLSKILAKLPEVTRTDSGSHATFRVGNPDKGKVVAYFLNDHHGDGIVSVACKVAPGTNTDLAASFPDRYYLPAYIGPRGWVALRLDGGSTKRKIDWEEVEGLIRESYRLCAPKSLAAKVKLSGDS